MKNYFSEKELSCPCCGELKMDVAFVEKLNHFREVYGAPVYLTSGYRCRKHNEKVGGALNSKHMEGIAADLKITSSKERFTFVEIALICGFTGIGVAKTFVHVDTRDGAGVMWLY